FKDVNDSFGHSAGDELLQQVAQRFASRLRDGDIISRLGGDEFAIVLEYLAQPEDAGRIATEMINAQGAPYKLIGGAEVHIGMSAGIVLFPDHGDNASDLLQHADAALYKAKSEGRGIYRYYTDELTDSARKRIACETSLRRAVENNEFEVYYQPQVHIPTGRIVGAEALVRWNDPERGMIFPSVFIPVAEDTGLIGVIGEWVLNETCRQGKVWIDSGHRLMLAVNLSAHQVRHQNIPEMVEAALKKTGYPADKLELELTESALMQREEETVAMLHVLRAMGIRLAIDDFGTGYSSLSYLKRFPINVLKIDKSFVDDLPFDADDMAIVTAIIAMGHALGFQVLAEGTERIEQIEFLKERGCTMYQGYFKSPPVPAAEFEKLLL
ncbi:MAG: bifunctional diguanylate cyclase/phosphodiesterase, partial [Sulfuricurvum sp.]|nr:bifunctional diguanylate cyclase/phosphodiesterase [Sulfuricurvum sp.]